jgi:hypothetical protein
MTVLAPIFLKKINDRLQQGQKKKKKVPKTNDNTLSSQINHIISEYKNDNSTFTNDQAYVGKCLIAQEDDLKNMTRKEL